jgi:hypothetical protein
MNLSNVGASVRQRPLTRARGQGEEYQVLLTVASAGLGLSPFLSSP